MYRHSREEDRLGVEPGVSCPRDCQLESITSNVNRRITLAVIGR